MEQLKSGPKEPIMMPGPKFGENGGWWSGFKKWLSRNSQRIIVIIILILIIAGGFYLFSKSPQPAEILNPEEQLVQDSENQTQIVNPGEVTVPTDTQNQQATTITPTPGQAKAELVKTENGQIIIKAKKGAGITHMSREALKQYLENNQELKNSLKPEQKIYIEDYLKDKTGAVKITVDKQLSFDENTIKEAIDKAQKLTDNQIKNLHKYVLLVPSLSA